MKLNFNCASLNARILVIKVMVSMVAATGEAKSPAKSFISFLIGYKDTIFCLVHLDTDRYKSTLEGLEYFYNRLVSGGRVVIHDYNCIGTPGVKLAVDEFVKKFSLSHLLISICESQAMLLKI